MISQLLHILKSRQTELSGSLAVGTAQTWEAYQRMVGEYQGLKYAVDAIDNLLREEEGRE